MIQVLLFYDELSYKEWLDKTTNLLPMDPKTFIDRKKKLEKYGLVKHKQRKYFIIPRNRRKIYENLNKKIVQFQNEFKAVKELPQNAFFLKISIRLLEKVFQELYTQLQYERLCFWNDYSKGEQTKINQSLNRCEKIISDLADLIKKKHPEMADKLLPPPRELIFIEKVQRSK